MLDQLSARSGLPQSLSESKVSQTLSILLGGTTSNDPIQNASISLANLNNDVSVARSALLRNLIAQHQEEERQRLLLTLQLSSVGRSMGAPVGSSTQSGLHLGHEYLMSSRPESFNVLSQIPLDNIAAALLTAESSPRAMSAVHSSVSSSGLGAVPKSYLSVVNSPFFFSNPPNERGLTLSNLQKLLQTRQEQIGGPDRPKVDRSSNDSSFIDESRSLPSFPPSASYNPPRDSELTNTSLPRRRRKGRTGTFPQKLHQMLTDLEKQEGGTRIASFLLHGRSFAIHNPSEFVRETMPKYFRMSRFSSFQRQLNLYDFQRINDGPNKGGYYHELFVRDRPILSTMMKRNKIKGVKLMQQQRAGKNKTKPDKHSDDATLTDESEKVDEAASTTS